MLVCLIGLAVIIASCLMWSPVGGPTCTAQTSQSRMRKNRRFRNAFLTGTRYVYEDALNVHVSTMPVELFQGDPLPVHPPGLRYEFPVHEENDTVQRAQHDDPIDPPQWVSLACNEATLHNCRMQVAMLKIQRASDGTMGKFFLLWQIAACKQELLCSEVGIQCKPLWEELVDASCNACGAPISLSGDKLINDSESQTDFSVAFSLPSGHADAATQVPDELARSVGVLSAQAENIAKKISDIRALIELNERIVVAERERGLIQPARCGDNFYSGIEFVDNEWTKGRWEPYNYTRELRPPLTEYELNVAIDSFIVSLGINNTFFERADGRSVLTCGDVQAILHIREPLGPLIYGTTCEHATFPEMVPSIGRDKRLRPAAHLHNLIGGTHMVFGFPPGHGKLDFYKHRLLINPFVITAVVTSEFASPVTVRKSQLATTVAHVRSVTLIACDANKHAGKKSYRGSISNVSSKALNEYRHRRGCH